MLTWLPSELEGKRELERKIREAVAGAGVQRDFERHDQDSSHENSGEASALANELAPHVRMHIGIPDDLQIRIEAGAQSFGPAVVAAALIAKAGRSGPTEAIPWLERLMARTSASGSVYMPLWGLPTTNGVVELAPGFQLHPFAQIPDSIHKRMFVTNYSTPRFYLGAPAWGVPKVALRATRAVKPLFSISPDRVDHFELGQHTKLDQLRDLLTLVGSCCPIAAESWFQFDDPEVELARLPWPAFRGVHNEVRPVYPWVVGEFDGDLAQKVVQTYFAASEKVRDRVSGASNRLNLAKRRMHQGNKALDLCMALESVLSSDSRDNSFVLALRAALLLESTVDERTRVREQVKAVYRLRNKVAHGGLQTVGDGEREKRTVGEGLEICRRVMRRILVVGDDIDWSRVELGAG